jgi:hypothetical protein
MIVEGRAVVATPEEAEAYRASQLAARKAAEKADLAKRLQVAIVTDSDLRATGYSRNDRNSGGK